MKSTKERNQDRLEELRGSCAQNLGALEKIASSTPFDRKLFVAMTAADLEKLKEKIRFESYLANMELRRPKL